MIKVLIVDDNAGVRAALKRIIEKTSDIAVGGEAADGLEAINSINEETWDIVLLDISLPDMSGLEVLKRIKTQRSDLCVLIVSVHSEEIYGAPAWRAGASGYLAKNRAAELLANAIRQVATGRQFFSPSTSEQFGDEKDHRLTWSSTKRTHRRGNSES